MCTVTFIPRKTGYCLGMNRDEQRSRQHGLPPTRKVLEGRSVVNPSEPSGGTWIALNDHGVTFALINWYSVPRRVKANPLTRGDVVNHLSGALSENAANRGMEELPLHRINPFRVIGVFPETRAIVEWQWNLKRLVRKRHHWRAQQWISSGFDEPEAQRIRTLAFRAAAKQKSAGSVGWLRRLHRSHEPQVGPFSTCMHRSDAVTVSYTEIAMSRNEAVMRYHPGALCERARFREERLGLGKARRSKEVLIGQPE